MSTQDVATEFTSLCRSGKFEEAGKRFWSEEIVSVEPMSGDMHELKGRKAVEGKGKWFSDNHQVHSVKVEGPFVNGDEFAVRFEMEITPKGKSRQTMKEIALYRVEDEKVCEEKFFNA